MRMKINRGSLSANAIPSGLILGAIALVYAGTVRFDFCWDDLSYLIQNPYIREISWNNISVIFSRNFEGNFAPLHILFYAIQHAVWGMNPGGYHAVSVILHIFNSIFLFILIRTITGRKDAALFAALIFAVHPVQVENVAWVSEQKSLLAMAFFIPAFYLYVLDADHRKVWFYWASVCLYGLSLLAKVSTVSLPILLLLYDLCYRKTFEKRYVINKAPYFAVAGVMSLVSIFIQTSNRGMFYFKNDPFVTFLTTVVAIKDYLLNMIWPANLSAYYSLVYTRISEPAVVLSLLLIVSLTFGTVYLFRKDRQAGFWAVWFWAAILPNLNIIPLSVVMADRYLYIPLIGPAVLLGLAFFGPMKAWLLKHVPTPAGWVYAASGMLIILLAITSHARSRIWENNLTLWTDTVKRIQHGIPYTNLGASYLQIGNVEEAKKNFYRSIEIMPDYYLPYQNLGRLYLQENNLAGAEEQFAKVLSLDPKKAFASGELAKISIARNDMARALGTISEGLNYSPGDPSLLNLKAHVLARKEDFRASLEIYRQLTRLEPDVYTHWFNFGAVSARLGMIREAEDALKQAITIDGRLPNAYKELALLYERDGTNERSAANYERGLKDFQDNSQALRNLSLLYGERFPSKMDAILTFARRSLERSPGDPNGLATLGWAYSKKGDYKHAVEYYQQALSKRPNEPYLLYHTGIASLNAGDTKSGKAYLKELVQKHPDHPLSILVRRDHKTEN